VIERHPEAAVRRRYDLAIVGAGVYGIALTLEAARRGLRPLLVERHDFGGETSWNSLRIIHGGLRSLQRLDVRRFREMVDERRWWLRNFPELVEPLPCLMPLYGRGLRRPAVLRLALAASDLLSRQRNVGVRADRALPGGSILGPAETLAICPHLDRRSLLGGALWHDGFAPDSHRLLIEMLHWATACGAVVLNYVEATGLSVHHGKVTGLELRDADSGRMLEVEAPAVVNCSGPWCRQLAAAFDRDIPGLFHRSLAFNVCFDREPLAEAAVAVAPEVPQGRTYFLVPWKGRILAGTFHAKWSHSREQEGVDDRLLERLLDDLNGAIPGLDLQPQEALRTFSGLVPARRSGSDELVTRDVIRHHADHGGPEGLFSVSGVKFTTARGVAEKALRKIQAWRGAALSEPSGTRRPDTLHPSPWGEFRKLQLNDSAEACRYLRRLVGEEAVLHLDDLMYRRTDWAFDPRESGSRATLVAQLLDSDEILAGGVVGGGVAKSDR